MIKMFKTHRKTAIVGLVVGLIAATGGIALAFFTSPGAGTGSAQVANPQGLLINQLGGTPLYNSTVDASTYTQSQCFTCVGLGELGNAITLSGANQPLSSVTFAMTNFNDNTGSLPMTLNIFQTGTGATPGALIATDSQTFSVPDFAGGYNPSSPPGYGLTNFNVTFNFASQNVTLPGTIIYELQWDGTNTDPGTDGVNVQYVNENSQVSVGSDPAPDTLFASLATTTNGDGYTETGQDAGPGEITCDTMGTTFQQWSTANTCPTVNNPPSPGMVPAVEFDTSTMADLYPGGPAQNVNFSITNPGTSPVTVTSVNIGIATDNSTGFIESQPGNTGSDVNGCYASWFSVSPDPVTGSATIQPGSTVDYIGSTAISMSNPDSNQDACKGASIGLTFASS